MGSIIQRSKKYLLVLFPLVIITFCYGNTLSYGFTDADDFSLIESNRIQSFEDLTNIFTQRLMQGTDFESLSARPVFYRPIPGLTYAFDYSVWGLNPYGYHLTNFAIIIAVVIVLFFFLRELSNSDGVAWVGSIIFSAHSLLLNVVPSITRRQDLIALLFLMIAFICFIRYMKHGDYRRLSLILSVFFSILAFLSKEITFLFPAIIFAYLFIVVYTTGSLAKRARHAFQKSYPIFVSAFVLFMWRLYLLGGFGAYQESDAALGYRIKHVLLRLIDGYFFYLAAPSRSLGYLLNPNPGILAKFISVLLLLTLISLIYKYRRSMVHMYSPVNGSRYRALKILLVLAAAVSLVAAIIYPLLASVVNQKFLESYSIRYRLFSLNWDLAGQLPPEYFFYKLRNLVADTLSAALFTSVVYLIFVSYFPEIKRIITQTSTGKLLTFFIIWLLMPLTLFVLTTSYYHYYAVFSLPALCGAISVILVHGFNRISHIAFQARNESKGSWGVSSTRTIIFFTVALIFTISLLIPVTSSSKHVEWGATGDVTAIFLKKFPQVMEGINNNTVVNVYDIPYHIYTNETKKDYPTEVLYIYGYSIESWLAMTYPDKHVRVEINERTYLPGTPKDLDLKVVKKEEDEVFIQVDYIY